MEMGASEVIQDASAAEVLVQDRLAEWRWKWMVFPDVEDAEGDVLAGVTQGDAEVDGQAVAVRVSQKQLEANRRNALKSTGPRSAEGKARSARNAWKHGFSGLAILAQTENIDEFYQFRAKLWQGFEPASLDEQILVDQLGQALWRHRRFLMLETEALDGSVLADPGTAKWRNAGSGFVLVERLSRYGGPLSREIHRCLDQLRKIRDARMKGGKDLDGVAL